MYEGLKDKVAVVTGASAGIGEATVRALAKAGCHVAMGARRVERLAELHNRVTRDNPGVEIATAPLDVQKLDDVRAFGAMVKERFGTVHILVNNAGLVRGVDPLVETPEENVQVMIETNVVGLIRMTQEMMPALIDSGNGHIVNVASIAGWYAYPGGSVYCATKAAVRSLSQAMRVEIVDKPVRKEKASEVYKGMKPLVGEDIADCIVWAVSRPKHVNIDEILVTPQEQGGILKVHRPGAPE